MKKAPECRSEIKVGIITLTSIFNYGNRLQCYASFKIYSKLRLKPVCLILDVTKNRSQQVKDFIKTILGMRQPKPESLMTPERTAAFGRFEDSIPSLTVKGWDEISNQFSVFSTGSDQVWNPKYVSGQVADWYFLTFARPEQRIALAPSIGIDSLSFEEARFITEHVSDFLNLSVRERRGAELIKECSGRDAEIICDPTLTLSSEEWRTVADDRCTPSEPYVFTYLLGGIGTEADEVLNKVTDHGRIPVIPLSDRQKPGEPDAGPAEFISLIDHAEHVITDSFHAAVFSSILQTPLTIVHREGGASMFSRLEQLSQMLGIEEKVYGSPTYDLSRAGDYEGVPEAIDRERMKFMNYLEGCLDKQLPGWREGTRG